ncbi:sugar phosphate isomerase/epimerase family protein [Streptomyces sp. CA-249302]|uniref:sugar phosphate isomerase/epimerase family protein n=1 Tax=Streptomyces sp. CA-249302 TaxID=3240058 RepID=UPI003D8A0213
MRRATGWGSVLGRRTGAVGRLGGLSGATGSAGWGGEASGAAGVEGRVGATGMEGRVGGATGATGDGRTSSNPQSDLRTRPRPNTPLHFGYGTNGLTDLRLDDAFALLADLGYDGVGLTLDHMHLDPQAPDLGSRTRHVAERLGTLGLDVTVETGARYVLDPRRKHGPTLLDPDPDDRSRRVGLLIRAVQVAADLGAHAVHCFSGITPDGTDLDTAWKRLADSLTPVIEAAATAGVPLAIEPEPGHLLATLADFHHLRRTLGDPEGLGLTLDIGHCQCLEPLSPADCLRAAAPWLRHVQIEDMCRGIHEHLPLGDGEIDFPSVLGALAATGYQGLTVVELPRHSHAGPHFAEHSLPFLRDAAATAVTPLDSAPLHGDPSATPEGSSTS